ncbi:MAG: hypothetical protein ACKVG1_02130 [Rhodospirillales bacterium]
MRSCLRSAEGAPSGVNMQPWHFRIIPSFDKKHKICLSAETEES